VQKTNQSKKQAPMKRIPILNIVVAIAVLQATCVWHAVAEIVNISADADALVSSAYPNENFGSYQWIFLGWDADSGVLAGHSSPAKLMRSYIHFNVRNGLPAGTTPSDIFSARIRLRKTASNNGDEPPRLITVNATAVAGAWIESTITFNNKPPNGAFLGSFDWTEESFISIPIGLATIQEWYNNPSLNYGVEIAAQWAEINHYWIRIAGKENTSGFELPTLELTTQPMTKSDLRGWKCVSPQSAHWGQTVSLQCQVTNQNTGSSGSGFTQKFYLSANSSWGDSDDVPLGSYTHPVLSGNSAGAVFNVSLTLPAAPPFGQYGLAGTYRIGMKTDADNQVSNESDEGNNGPESERVRDN